MKNKLKDIHKSTVKFLFQDVYMKGTLISVMITTVGLVAVGYMVGAMVYG